MPNQTIGPAGGVIESADRGLTIEVPAGAVGTPTTITIQAMTNPPPGAVGTVYEIGPSGTVFTTPVSISIRVDDSIADPLTAIVSTWNEETSKWELLPSGTRTSGTRFISGLTSHFSNFGVVEPSEVWGCAPSTAAICPAGYYMSWVLCLAQFELVSQSNPCFGRNKEVLCLPLPETGEYFSVCDVTRCPEGYDMVENLGETPLCGTVFMHAECGGWNEFICKSSSYASSEWASWPLPPLSPTAYTWDSEIVTDGVTGLMWQRTVPDNGMTWADAKTYCDELSLAGFSDWRLPNHRELMSIVDYTRYLPSINADAFPGTPTGPHDRFWSSSLNVYNNNGAWYVDFMYGMVYGGYFTYAFRVRCVR